MANAKAFGSISIIDSTDGGQLSVTPQSNQPLIVIEDPDNLNSTYTPDWSKSNLILTPMIYFSYSGENKQLSLPEEGLTVIWKRQEGSGEPTDLIAGETVANGILTVSKNFLANISSGILTYWLQVQYTNPDTGISVESQAKISFALLKNSEKVRHCVITGESVFLYNTGGALVGVDSITLNATLTNVSVQEWQYKNASGQFVPMTKVNNPSINGQTIKILANENILFNNDTAVIKLVTSDPDITDIHTIVKIRDGAAGKDVYSVVLSNEDHTLPCDGSGNVTSYFGASTDIIIYKAGIDDTANWNIKATPSSGIEGTFANNIYTVTKMTVDAAYVEFVCTKSSTATIKKRFTLIRQKPGLSGDDAVIYQLKCSTLTMNINESGVFSPENVTFNATKQIGANISKDAYSGRFKIYESTDGNSFGTPKYTSTVNETSKTYTPSSANIRTIKVELYASGGTTVLLDSQTIVITKDGRQGEDGVDGSGGTSVILGNELEGIPCNTDGLVKSLTDITIPFYGYIGIKRAVITCTPGTLPLGVTVIENKSGDESSGGYLIIRIPAGNALGSASDLRGIFNLTFTCNGSSVDKKFTWVKNVQSQNSVLLQIFAPHGDVIVNQKNNVDLVTQLTDGSLIVTSGITYQWAKFSGGGYQNISGQTADTLTVTPAMVDTFASFRCTATYKGKNYVAYWCVQDKNDPLDFIVMSSIGTQITKDTVAGAIYCMAYQNGVEVDPLKTTIFSTTPPIGAQAGDYYYHLDKTSKTAILKKYSGSSWINAPAGDNPKGTYKYYRRNQNGDELDTAGEWKAGKVIYIDRSLIDGALIINVEADIPLG